jgi:hypothetical protein
MQANQLAFAMAISFAAPFALSLSICVWGRNFLNEGSVKKT